MPYQPSQYQTPFGRPRPRTNYFAWTVAILCLTGFAFAAWLGSFYIFWQPERPDSYRVLRKLHRIDPLRRFELTAAPPGEFLSPKQLYDKYNISGRAEMAKVNSELARNYIRNFQQVHGLVPYIVGRYRVIDVRQLGAADIFTSGMVALAVAVDNPQLLIEHVYPAEGADVPLMKQTLMPGLEIKLDRAHDISAVIHAERTQDGRLLITAMPLLYGTYTVTKGSGTFTLEPPLDLNLGAGWPLIKPQELRAAEERFAASGQSTTNPGTISIPGLQPTNTPPPAENQLVRVEPARAVATPVPTPTPTPTAVAKLSPGKKGKGQKGAPSSTAAVVKATPTPASTLPPAATPPLPPQGGGELASTAGTGATWKTYAPGKMPLGRLIDSSDLATIADRGFAGERIYLRGQFVVNLSDASKAILRPKSRVPDSVVRLAGGNATRIVVEFPAGQAPPTPGSMLTRDEVRPLEVTEVRKQEDGQITVFAREIMQP